MQADEPEAKVLLQAAGTDAALAIFADASHVFGVHVTVVPELVAGPPATEG